MQCKRNKWKFRTKVEDILKGSLDSIPSPSSSREHLNFLFLFLGGPNITGRCQQTFCPTKFVDNTQQCFAFTSQANFPAAHNLNFY